jgi:hypothetical protein
MLILETQLKAISQHLKKYFGVKCLTKRWRSAWKKFHLDSAIDNRKTILIVEDERNDPF